MESPTPSTKPSSRIPSLPFWWVSTVNALVFVNTIQFFSLPRGTGIRPMGWGVWVFMMGGAGFLGIILGMMRRYERMPYQWAVIIMGFTPVPLGFTMLYIARAICGFIIEK